MVQAAAHGTRERQSIIGRSARAPGAGRWHSYQIMLSTRPDKSVGSDKIWDDATAALRGALERKGWDYTVDEGGGAFYGPKIDLKIRDAIGRLWQCSTIQADFNLPERFELEYVASDGQRKRPPVTTTVGALPPPSAAAAAGAAAASVRST